MTAFARQDASVAAGVVTWEVRSVNHRYLEPNFRLPEAFRETENRLRDLVRKYLSRGKIDCSLKWQPSLANKDGLAINDDVLSGLAKALHQVGRKVDNPAPVDTVQLLQWPGLIDSESSDRKQLLNDVVATFEKALKVLVESRAREGAQLSPLFDQRLTAIDEIVADVRQQLPAILQKQSENIRQRFEAASVELDASRVEQEMVLLAQKTDVDEELDRLAAHVKEVRSVLERDEPVGRRLDFLMQELNREANTLSSKSIVTETTKAAVELKVLIEQMREQVQNVE